VREVCGGKRVDDGYLHHGSPHSVAAEVGPDVSLSFLISKARVFGLYLAWDAKRGSSAGEKDFYLVVTPGGGATDEEST